MDPRYGWKKFPAVGLEINEFRALEQPERRDIPRDTHHSSRNIDRRIVEGTLSDLNLQEVLDGRKSSLALFDKIRQSVE